MNSAPNRITKLDGLRGLLSLIVALNHSFLVVAIPAFANVWHQNYLDFYSFQSKVQQLFMILGNGGVAVSLFFVLSGLVLGQSLSRTEISPKGLLAFYAKRVIRLYPVYLFVILLTALYMRFGFYYRIFPHASTWFLWWLNFEMSLHEFFYNLFFIHTYLGGVTWTLRVIFLASLILPAFYQISKKTSWWTDLLFTAGLVYASFTILNFENFRDFRYLYMFFLGLILPKFKNFFARLPGWYIKLTLPLSLLLLLLIRYSTDEYLGGVVESIISWKIIGLISYSDKTKLFDFLNYAVFQFFGRISYSLYLIHFSILYMLSRLMFIWLPNLPYADNYLAIHSVLFVLSLSVATLVSLLVYRWVEIPSLTLSKRVGEYIIKS